MKSISGLDHIGIRVGDFRRSIEFYKTLGFELMRSDFKERVSVLRHKAGIVLNILDSADDHSKAENILMDEDVKYSGYTHVALRVLDIRDVIRVIDKLGYLITEGPVTFGDGKKSIFVRDPDRNVIEFTQDTSTTVCRSNAGFESGEAL